MSNSFIEQQKIKLRESFTIPENLRAEFFDEVCDNNFNRAFYVAVSVAIISIILIVLDVIYDVPLVTVHLGMLFASLLMILLFSLVNKKKIRANPLLLKKSGAALYFLILLFAISLISLNVVFNEQKELVYLIGALGIGIVLIIKPLYSFFMFAGVHALFTAINASLEEDVMLFVQTTIDTTSFIIIVWVISIIVYRTKINEFVSKKTIEEQNKELTNINMRLEERNTFIKKTFGRYMSDDIVEDLIKNPDSLSLGGEKKHVSIIMADLRGFTTISESLTPEAVVAILNNYFSEIIEIVHHYRGTVIEIIGDAIMIIFGAPVKCEDHAGNAVACALQMQLSMEKVNNWNRENGYTDLEIGIGINSGWTVIGNIGSERRTKYGLVGRNVNLAARVESYTVGGQVLVTRNVIDASHAQLNISSEMIVMPKGVKEHISIFDISGIGEPYNIFLPGKDQSLTELISPIYVKIFTVDFKHCSAEAYPGIINKLSVKEANIETDIDTLPMDSVKLQIIDDHNNIIADEIYGIVYEINDIPQSVKYPHPSLKQNLVPGKVMQVKFKWVPPEGKKIMNDSLTK